MPGRNGFAVLEDICGVQPHASVILMSAHAELEIVVRVLKLGAHDFATKSFENYQRLESTIVAAADYGRTVAENGAGGDPGSAEQEHGVLRRRIVEDCIRSIVGLEEPATPSLVDAMKREILETVVRAMGRWPPREAVWPIVHRLPMEFREYGARQALRLLANRSLAAQAAGISRRTLNRWLPR